MRTAVKAAITTLSGARRATCGRAHAAMAWRDRRREARNLRDLPS